MDYVMFHVCCLELRISLSVFVLVKVLENVPRNTQQRALAGFDSVLIQTG
jgi:hypothetical protein